MEVITMHSKPLRYAHRFAENGLSVFPVARNGKGPCHNEIDSWKKEATTDEKQIQQWFKQPAPPNVGIKMGKWEAGGSVFAVDIDIGETSGYKTWEERLAEEEEPVPETFTVDTPSGGTHLYFQAPPGVQTKSANHALGDSIDVKGHGGYVVGPPSSTGDGTYTIRDDAPDEIAQPPFWLVSAVSKNSGKRERKRTEPSAPNASFSNNPDTEVIEDALQAISPQPDYEKWVRIIAAVKDAVDSDRQAARLLEQWSPENRHGDYTYEERLRNAPDEQITVGTLFHFAKQEGWTPPWQDSGSPRGDGKAGEVGKRGSGGGEPSPEEPEIEPESAGPGDTIRALYEKDKKQARVEASNQIKEELTLATHRESGHLHWWDEEEDVYDKEGEKVARSRLVELLGKHYSQHEEREIIGRVKPETYRSEFGAEGFVPVANGDLKVTEDGVELHDPTPERGFRSRSPADWNPDTDAPIFQNFLESVVLREVDRKALQEYVGYTLMHWGLPLHKALFLVGPQAAGKSTLLEVICEMLGKATHLSPHQLVSERFCAVELEDSWANVAADISSDLLSNVGRFKEITAGDRIYVERKFEQGYTIQPATKHFYSANQLPDIKIDDDAFFRRVLIVPFPETVPKKKRDPALPKKLKLELDGILRWAVEGLVQVLETGDFTGDLSPSETRRVWQEHASSIGRFKVRCLDVTGRHDQDVEVKDEVFTAYRAFCEENGLSAESQSQLTRVLKRDPKIDDGDRTPPDWDQQKDCYTGVRLKPEERETPN
ncbi:phage/plasmid primase, P4 family [Salinibacter sp.]|jgi:P4 family phage/plasmid primase-like protien|uniref:phage/plasmid primase, P4 family n=1 Tax=Salinibacter sp. TaxID=2065818 RepID=UPI001ABA47F1|nr:phage/plasmid primase, P4 family [Salinibacter sp.]